MFPVRLTPVLALVFASLACRPPSSVAPKPEPKPLDPVETSTADPATESESEPMLPGVKKEDLAVGTGPEAKKGDTVLVHYTGTLLDGTKFDSSHDRNTPFEFTLGGGMVIPGWELGVVGMKQGGKRRLVIPPHLGYGAHGSPPKIPGESTLVFEVELLEIVSASVTPAEPNPAVAPM